jgi:Fe-S-cluster containining protein
MSDVPCKSCSACCRHHLVHLSAADEPHIAAYDTRQVGASRVLKLKENGDCTHLGPGGCTIYDRRPLVCRSFDCRKQLMTLAGSERRRFSNSALGDAAKRRLATLDAGDLRDLPDYQQRAAALRIG